VRFEVKVSVQDLRHLRALAAGQGVSVENLFASHMEKQKRSLLDGQ